MTVAYETWDKMKISDNIEIKYDPSYPENHKDSIPRSNGNMSCSGCVCLSLLIYVCLAGFIWLCYRALEVVKVDLEELVWSLLIICMLPIFVAIGLVLFLCRKRKIFFATGMDKLRCKVVKDFKRMNDWDDEYDTQTMTSSEETEEEDDSSEDND